MESRLREAPGMRRTNFSSERIVKRMRIIIKEIKMHTMRAISGDNACRRRWAWESTDELNRIERVMHFASFLLLHYSIVIFSLFYRKPSVPSQDCVDRDSASWILPADKKAMATAMRTTVRTTARTPTTNGRGGRRRKERRVFGEAYRPAIWNTVDQFLQRLRTVDVDTRQRPLSPISSLCFCPCG